MWSAVVQSDSIVSIGYQPIGYTQIEDKIHLIDINESEWANIQNKLLTIIVQETNRLHPGQKFTAQDILIPEPNGILPHLELVWR